MIYATPFSDGDHVVLTSEYYSVRAKMGDLDRATLKPEPIEKFQLEYGGWQAPASWFFLEGIWDEKTGLTYFAFLDLEARDLFRLLVGIRGLGPALALRLLSQQKPAALRSLTAVELKRLEGVGPKLSQAIFDGIRGIKAPTVSKAEKEARKAATMAAIEKVFKEASGQPTEPLKPTEPTKKPKKGTKQ